MWIFRAAQRHGTQRHPVVVAPKVQSISKIEKQVPGRRGDPGASRFHLFMLQRQLAILFCKTSVAVAVAVLDKCTLYIYSIPLPGGVLYTLWATLYTLYILSPSICYTLFSIYSIPRPGGMLYTLYAALCTRYIIFPSQGGVLYIEFILYTLYSKLYIPYPPPRGSALYSIGYTLYFIYSIPLPGGVLYTLYAILYTIYALSPSQGEYSILYTLYSKLYILYSPPLREYEYWSWCWY